MTRQDNKLIHLWNWNLFFTPLNSKEICCSMQNFFSTIQKEKNYSVIYLCEQKSLAFLIVKEQLNNGFYNIHRHCNFLFAVAELTTQQIVVGPKRKEFLNLGSWNIHNKLVISTIKEYLFSFFLVWQTENVSELPILSMNCSAY